MEARKALAMWVERGLISSDLGEELSATLAEEDRTARSQLMVSLFVSVGAVLVGGGFFLFIASHWDGESPVRRLLLLVAAYLLAVIAALVAERQRLEVVGKGLWFLAAVTVGVNVFLIGQVFHLPLTYWQGTLLWLIAVLAVGRVAPSFPLGWLAVALTLLTLGWISVPESRQFDQASFLWDAAGLRALVAVVGLALVAIAGLAQRTEAEYLVRPARATGVAMVALPLVVSTFHPAAFAAIFEIHFRLIHIIVLVAVAGIAAGVWLQSRAELLGYAVAAMLGLLAVLLPQVGQQTDAPDGLSDFRSLPWLAEPFARSELLFFLYGLVIMSIGLATVVAGRHYDVRALVNVGLVSVGVLVMAAYIGRVAGALPTSIAFLVGGVLLVALAVVVERKRRDLVATPGGVT